MATLGIFVKQPVPGTVKTRLGADIGNDQACELYAAFIKDLFEKTRSLAVQRVFAYAPENNAAKEYFSAMTTPAEKLWSQPETNLGMRLAWFFTEHLHENGPVVVIGSDSPSLPASLIQQAFEALEEKDVVLGPAVDGGYYLVGQRVFVPQMFEQIDWSEPTVLHQTVCRLEESGHSLEILTPWYDIDNFDDLQFLRGHLEALAASGNSEQIPVHTRQLLEEVFGE